MYFLNFAQNIFGEGSLGNRGLFFDIDRYKLVWVCVVQSQAYEDQVGILNKKGRIILTK